jgi:hypothetical protein
MRRALACLLACAALLLLGACSRAERNETRDDLARFRQARAVEYQQLKADLRRYAIDQKLRSQELPADLSAFMEWRRREWWNLTDELAALMAYEWDTVHQLSVESARFYGYELRNFPMLADDVARFFEHADPEWDRLVRDVCIFVEWRSRELLPLRKELRDAYDRIGWEAGNLQIDFIEFIEWRSREWRQMQQASAAFMDFERSQGRRLREDLRRFRAARALEANYLVADCKAWWYFETQAMPPRLIADVGRWWMLPARELNQLRGDIARFGEGIGENASKLVDDVARYANAQIDLIPLLAVDVDRFFEVYDRELAPLAAETRRWWRSNVALGIVLRDDMRQFFLEHGRTESAELDASVRRFFSYSHKEWKDFKASLARFLYDDSGRAFGSRGVPSLGDAGQPVFDDPRAAPARGYDAGNE